MSYGKVEVIQKVDDLNQVIYCFWLTGVTLYLDNMYVQSRESRRHKFKTDLPKSYSRILRRDFGVKEEPEVDIDILAEAVSVAKKKITFEKWENK